MRHLARHQFRREEKEQKMKRLYKNWMVHNCIAHPVMYFAGYISERLATAIHDRTLPEQQEIKTKGVRQ